jgi:hypothetical protein
MNVTITKSMIIIFAAGLVVGAGGAWIVTRLAASNDSNRQAQVRMTGSQVMPFDLDRTTHVFTKVADDGVEEVRVKTQTTELRLT